MKNRVLAESVSELSGQTITLAGWVHSRRDHGGVIFIDMRDHTGLVQLVINPEQKQAFEIAESLRDEFVIRVSGEVRMRGEGLENPNIKSGSVEVVADDIIILNKSDTLPIQPFAEAQANEELRLKYRFLDLRRDKMQQMLKKRAEMFTFIRHFMEQNYFTEIATPILANSSPEGARDFLIPSRLQQGKFYALPQAPQQFKQLLMVGGVHRYYQLAACFRDEDPRADRLYGEFYQLDLEMSFVEDGVEVRETIDPLIRQLVTEFAGKELVFDETPSLTYREAMERYGSDKPDLRFDMQLVELTDVFSTTEFGVFKNAECIKAICVKNGSSLTRKQIDQFTDIAKSEGAGGLAYIVYEGNQPKSPIAKFLTEAELSHIQQRVGAEDGDIVFFGADKRKTVNKVLGRLRSELADHFGLKDPNKVALAWIIDFPFYEWDETKKRIDFGHNPFSMPKGGLDTLERAKTDEEKLSIIADQYDMTMNGYEVCSGGVRNHNPEVLYRVFNLLGYDEKYVNQKFGAMIEAFKFGAPPHAGCAFGVDRILMELMNESNIREIIAFPKNGSGVDLMMGSPSLVDQAQLDELGVVSSKIE
ncbi:aspartate--tRNA ligase [Candidatus Saccharibacteria bacterium]|nr:aspartate--tRNA ligase [Candidatus Saccharibacteria bacterium]